MSSMAQTPLALPPHPTTTLFNALESSTTLAHLKQVHAQILRRSNHHRGSNSLLLQLVLSSCAHSSSLDYALAVFSHIPRPDTRLSNKFLRELSRSADPEKALLVYEWMRREGLSLDRFSFPPLLKAVSRASDLVQGMEIHGLASKLGFSSDPFVQTGLVRMYAVFGQIMEARLVFDKMPHRDVVAWSIMIVGYGYCRYL